MDSGQEWSRKEERIIRREKSQYDILRNQGHDYCGKDEFSASQVVSVRLKSLLLMDARVNQVPR